MTGNSSGFAIALADRARSFFDGIGNSPKLKDYLAEGDHIAQFVPKSGDPFFVQVQGGKLTFGKGAKFPEEMQECIYAIEVEECFSAIFLGDALFGESIFDLKIRIPGYRNKEPEIARFSRLLRMGVWALVPGARILMPAR